MTCLPRALPINARACALTHRRDGFHADYRGSYRKEAAEDGWNQMQGWLKKYGVLG
jgi:dienelactone hydrolase